MNDLFSPAAPAEMPLAEKIHLLPGAMDESVDVVERREGISDLEFASTLLSHAVRYLSLEQRAGRCISVRANRRAITILCECAESLTEAERRVPALIALHKWIDHAKQM